MSAFQAVIGAVNGVFGDYLAREGNGLAIELGFRDADGCALPLDRASLSQAHPQATGDLAVFLHGLCCDERIWQSWQAPDATKVVTYATRLQAELGYTPLFVRYNSGRHISENGEDFATALETLIANWPVKVRRLALIGHSMGGLVARSAAHQALESEMHWPAAVTHLVCLGSPHHGAPLERFGHLATTLLAALDITRPLATAINARSAGIKDLRHGSLRAEDWRQFDQDRHGHDTRQPVRHLPHARQHYIGAQFGYGPDDLRGHLFGDGLVPAASASGRHRDETRRLPYAEDDGLILHGLHHLQLVNHPKVYAHLARWLA